MSKSKSDPGADPAKSKGLKQSTPPTGGPSRRRSERVAVNHEFKSIEEFISEYVSDISRTGVFIRTDDPLPTGTKVDLRFTVIDDDFELIEGIGEVTRVVAPGAGGPSGMGVVFIELTRSSEGLVERLLLRRKP